MKKINFFLFIPLLLFPSFLHARADNSNTYRSSGHEFKESFKGFGRGVKKGTLATGHGFRRGAKATKRGFKKAFK